MEILIVVFAVTFFIADIALFFKLWKACDNIKRIANKYAPEEQNTPHRSRPPETKEEVERWLNEGE